MLAQTITIDQSGRVTIPRQILDALGVHPETEVIVELTEVGVVIKPKHSTHLITDRIASMSLSVADWNQMELEIEAGRVA